MRVEKEFCMNDCVRGAKEKGVATRVSLCHSHSKVFWKCALGKCFGSVSYCNKSVAVLKRLVGCGVMESKG